MIRIWIVLFIHLSIDTDIYCDFMQNDEEDTEPHTYECAVCKKDIIGTKEHSCSFRSCYHVVCLECFPNYVKEEYAHKQRIDCPKCGKIVHEDEIKCIIGSKKWKETVDQYSSNEDSKDNSIEDDENFE